MLVARDAELAQVASALDSHRLVTLTGTGGVGKTTVARAAEREWRTTTFFADLTPLDSDDLAEGLAGTLGFVSFAGLVTEAGEHRWLIVLDNCEHVVDGAATLAGELLAAGTELRILATSREPLDVPAEFVVRLDPLPTDGSPSPAALFYLEAVRRRGLDAAHDADVAELCRRLDGLPLALELAAARSSSMTAGEMLANLDARLDLLARSRPRGPDRHRSLAATVAWSYHLLDQSEQRLFAQLAVCPASFTLEMAAAVSGLSPSATLDGLGGLVERSMLARDAVGETSWFRMLDTIRSFAAERLDEAGGRDEAADRLLDAMAQQSDDTVAKAVVSDLGVPNELGRSFRTIHWAIEHAIRRGDEDHAFRLVAPLWWLEDVGHQSEAADLIERVIAQWPEPTPERSHAWGILGGLQRSAGRTERAAEVASIAAATEGVGAAYGHRTLGQIDRGAGRWAMALGHFEAGAKAARTAGHDWLAVELELHAAMTTARSGDLDRAITDLEHVIDVSGELHLVRAWAVSFLAYIVLGRDPERAVELSSEMLAIADRADDGWIRGSAHYNFAVVALMDGDLAEGADQLAASIDAFAAISNRTDITLSFLMAAATFVRLGDLASAKGTGAAERARTRGALGPFETKLLEELGPLPKFDVAVGALEPEEIARRLRAAAAAHRGERQSGATTSKPSRFVLSGDTWTLTFGGREVQQKDSKGLRDLHRLLARPHRHMAAVDLMDAGVVAGDPGTASDAEARRRYEQRIRDLQAELDAAERDNDPHRAGEARKELDLLVDHLAGAYGLGGRERPQSAPAEKARSAVTWRIRAAIGRIAESHSALGDHLDRSVKTGRFCVYTPAEPVDWEL